MSMVVWDFMKSPYFVSEFDNWHLKPGAPKEVQEEFAEYQSLMEDAVREGYDI